MAAQPGSLARPTAEERVYIASQWKLIWVRFKRHRIALAASVVIILLYFTATFSEFLAIHDPQASLAKRAFTPPQPIHLDGLRPAVYGLIDSRNPETFAQEHKQDRSKSYPIRIFVRGFEYELFGLFTTDIHPDGSGYRGDSASPLPAGNRPHGERHVVQADVWHQGVHVDRPRGCMCKPESTDSYRWTA